MTSSFFSHQEPTVILTSSVFITVCFVVSLCGISLGFLFYMEPFFCVQICHNYNALLLFPPLYIFIYHSLVVKKAYQNAISSMITKPLQIVQHFIKQITSHSTTNWNITIWVSDDIRKMQMKKKRRPEMLAM